jgi:predicted alpha/beta superfamily hydrolase
MIARRTVIGGAATAVAASLLPIKAFATGAGQLFDLGPIPAQGLAPFGVTVWLPPGYSKGRQRYGVVYMHDGQNLFLPARSNFNKVWAADRAAERLIAAGKTKPFIIVGIDQPGDARWRTYFPKSMFDLVSSDVQNALRNFARGPLVADAYLDFIVKQLKPMIDARYRTRQERAHTAIMGSSMGGLISLYALSRNPDVFRTAGCVSTHLPLADPAAWRDEDKASINQAWQRFVAYVLGKPDDRRIWLDHGTETLDSYYEAYQKVFDGALLKSGWKKGRDFSSKVYPGTAHEENAWAARLDEVLAWMLKGW